MSVEQLLTTLVKEKGISKKIVEMKEEIETCDKYRKCMNEFKKYTRIRIESDTFSLIMFVEDKNELLEVRYNIWGKGNGEILGCITMGIERPENYTELPNYEKCIYVGGIWGCYTMEENRPTFMGENADDLMGMDIEYLIFKMEEIKLAKNLGTQYMRTFK